MVLGNKEDKENDLRIDLPHIDELVTKNAIILEGNTKSISRFPRCLKMAKSAATAIS
jgi:hypothetical protein